jgi:hypothetical protein
VGDLVHDGVQTIVRSAVSAGATILPTEVAARRAAVDQSELVAIPSPRIARSQMIDDLVRAVSALGFGRWHRVRDRASVADVFPEERRCGIYVLAFTNGEAYVGKSTDVTLRYMQHRRSYSDLETMAFKVVRAERLDEEERATIRILESAGIRLRNVLHASIPHGPSDFALVMSAEDQDCWLTDLGYSDVQGPRTDDPETRRRYARRYQRFLYLFEAEDVVRVLRAYVRRGIPAFSRTEMSFWACTCLPGSPGYRVSPLARVNVYQQEVFSAYPGGWFTWHLAKSPLEQAFGPSLDPLMRKLPLVERTDHFYTSGGQDQVELQARGVDAALSLMQDADVLRSIRLFNLRLMQKGPCLSSRYHCFDLADRCYEQESDTDLVDAGRPLYRWASETDSIQASNSSQRGESILSRLRSLFGRH